MDFKQELLNSLNKQIKEEIIIEIPPNPQFGDFALPTFKLSKKAPELQKLLKLPKFIEKTEVKGPYLNFFIKKEIFTKGILEEILKNKFIYLQKEKTKVVIEYPSPNTNKPLHLGHIRNMIYGQAIVRLLLLKGNEVIEVNLLNDRGIHICKSMLAYKKWGNNSPPDKKPDHFVGDFYVLFENKNKENSELEKEALEMLNKWEKGDKQTIQLWKKMNSWATKGFDETFKQFNLNFKKTYKESAIYRRGAHIVDQGLKKGKFVKDKTGAIIAELEGYNLPNKVLLRQDGTSIYITQDIALAQEKYEDFKMGLSIIVSATEQNLHFKQLFKILEILGYSFNNEHLSYGMVLLPEGRMKSREGKVVDADDLINEITLAVKEEILKRYNNLSEKEIEKRSKVIAMAAMRYYILKIDPNKDIVYNPQESISFEGETGPYLLYTYARINSILKKSKKFKVNYEKLTNPTEQSLIFQLSQYNKTLEDSIKNRKPSLLCNLLFKIAQTYNEFYHSLPILKASTAEEKEARLTLSKATATIIKQGLSLLGIETLEEM